MDTPQKTFKRFADLGANVVRHWGRLTPLTVYDELTQSKVDDKTFYVLTHLADTVAPVAAAIAPVLDVLTHALELMFQKRLAEWEGKTHQEFRNRIEAMEEQHGPIDPCVYRGLRDNWFADAAWCIRTTLQYGGYPDMRPPLKGSDARKEYDRWMRRKRLKKKED